MIAVAIVNYNTRALLCLCLEAVQLEAPHEIIVVDNASTDDSVAMVHSEFPAVQVIANTANPGYGAAANQAIRSCTAPYVLLLNSDTVVQPGALRALKDYLDHHPTVAIVGPRLLNPDGSLQKSCFHFPTPLHVFLELSNLHSWLAAMPFLRKQYLWAWQHDAPRAVPWLLGAALLIRREAFQQIGEFNESFFMYNEEVDLCLRLHMAGWRIDFAPVADIVHIGGASTIQQRAAMVEHLFKSRFDHYHLHYSNWQFMQLKFIIIIGVLARIVRDRLKLFFVRVPRQRATLIEDLLIWRQVLASAYREQRRG